MLQAKLNRLPSNLPKMVSAMPSSIPRKKKLFLTDGTTVPLTGICVYMLRLSNSKPLPEEGFHKVSKLLL